MASRWQKFYGYLIEKFRSAAEYRKFKGEWADVPARTPSGDGHSVLVLPGFAADDSTTAPLQNILRQKGYDTHGWDGGTNMGLTDKTICHLRERLEKIYEENGHRKISLVGHSLGGIYARELAREYPDMVRDVITIGSPFGVGQNKKSVPAFMRMLISMFSDGNFSLNDEEVIARMLTPPPMPTTSLFSKIDDVAGWPACLNPAAPLAENVEIKDVGHMGIVWSPETFCVVLDRLAQPEGAWKPYQAPAQEPPPANPQWKPEKDSSFKTLFRKKKQP